MCAVALLDEAEEFAGKDIIAQQPHPDTITHATCLGLIDVVEWICAGRDARDALEAGVVQRAVVAASAATGLAALARGTFVATLDLAAALPPRDIDISDAAGGSGADAARPNADGLVLCRQNAGYDVLQLAFDGATGRRLAVAGLRTVQVLNILSRMLLQPCKAPPENLWGVQNMQSHYLRR